MENILDQPHQTDEQHETPLSQETVEKACRERIAALIAEQENLLQETQNTHEKNIAKVTELEKKWLLVKRSLKIAKSEKLGKTSIALIKDDRKEARRQLKEMRQTVKNEKQHLNAIQSAIELLKTII